MAYDKEAQARYAKKCKIYTVKLSAASDMDVRDYLDSTDEPFSTLVKRLIRAEIAAKSQKSQDE